MRPSSAAALLVGAARAADNSTNQTICATGLYTIVARGSGEPQGTGLMGVLADNVTERIPGSRDTALVYPATFTDPIYNDSVDLGVKSLQTVVNAYIDACPGGKIAIMGYSQGAQVVVDAVCGSDGANGFAEVRPLATSDIEKNVVAMVLFGDPTHVANTTFDRGTSINNGIFARSDASVRMCEGFADRLVSYCDTGDRYCDSGNNASVHSGYVARYGDEVEQYVVDRFSSAGNATATATATTTATASGTTAAPTGSTTATASASSGRASGTTTGAGAPSPTSTAAAAGLSAAAGAYLGAPLALALVALHAL